MKILELSLQAGDLPAMEYFYAGVLGLPRLEDERERLVFLVGGTRLCFEPVGESPAGSYHFAFNIPENQFYEAKEWLAGRAILSTDSQGADEFNFPAWNAHSLYFDDPLGNILEFIARHDLPSDSSEPFNAWSILSVSEIGLAVEDVPATVRELGAKLKVSPYRSQVSEDFTPLGDEEGLLIVVRIGREWYPETGKRAVALPLQALVLSGEGQSVMLSGPPYNVT